MISNGYAKNCSLFDRRAPLRNIDAESKCVYHDFFLPLTCSFIHSLGAVNDINHRNPLSIRNLYWFRRSPG